MPRNTVNFLVPFNPIPNDVCTLNITVYAFKKKKKKLLLYMCMVFSNIVVKVFSLPCTIGIIIIQQI